MKANVHIPASLGRTMCGRGSILAVPPRTPIIVICGNCRIAWRKYVRERATVMGYLTNGGGR